MKKREVLFLILIAILIFPVSVKSVPSEKLDLSPFNVSVNVIGLPSLSILSPKNGTYFFNESLKFG